MRLPIAIAIYMAALMGCALLDGYQFGDGTRVALSLRTVYCSTLPVEVRQAALRRMQATMEDYPEHSICDMEGFIIDIVEPLER